MSSTVSRALSASPAAARCSAAWTSSSAASANCSCWAAVAFLRLRPGGVALRAALVRPATRLVHRGPAFVHSYASARHLRDSGFDVLRLGLGPGLLGRRALLASAGALSGRLGPLLMARRFLLVGRPQRMGALLVAHGALFGRPRTLTGRLVACLDFGLLVVGGGVLVERVRAQLGDLRQALLDLRSV